MCVVAVLACADEKRPVKPPVEDPNGFRSLTSPENVMHNLRLAYNQRNIVEYQKLLQENTSILRSAPTIGFTFFFSAGDVSSGETPSQWGYLDEVQVTTNMFSNYDPNDPNVDPISDIDLQLFLDGVTWIDHEDVTTGETWKKATITYNYTIQAGVNTYIVGSSNAKGEFIVRPDVVDGKTEYRLVTWRDLGTDSRAVSASSARSQEKSWGLIKSLYGGG